MLSSSVSLFCSMFAGDVLIYFGYIGMGIGTLLRMLYVLAIVTYRSFRSENNASEDIDIIFEEVDVVPAPPAYPIDEKLVPVETKLVPISA